MTLQIDEDEKTQKVIWKIERIGWVLMFLFIIAALVGFLGNGPLSKKLAGRENSGFWIEYDRFERHSSPNKIKFHFNPKEKTEKKIQLNLNKDFIQSIDVHNIVPQPDKVEAASDGYHYTFNVLASNNATIIFEYEPDSYGTLNIKATYNENNRLTFSQWIYP